MDRFWNERYSTKEYVYGVLPNVFFKNQIAKLQTGKLLLPAEGEGRNAVFAAQNGWEVTAFDQSIEAKKKAEILAFHNNVQIYYDLGNVDKIEYPTDFFDAVALIFAHFPKEKRKKYYDKISSYLKKDGVLIMECFSDKHIDNQQENPYAGGPKDVSMLCNLEETKSELSEFDFEIAEETEIVLDEGLYHNGKANVIRIVARKK